MAAVRSKKLAIFFTLFVGAVSTAPPPPDCIPSLMSLANCMSFVAANSIKTDPEQSCCDGLLHVLTTGGEDGVKCLCDAFNNRASYGVQLNLTKSRELPSACGLVLPASCNLKQAAATVPARSPSRVPPSPVVIKPSSGSSHAASVELLICTAVATVFFIYQPKI